LKYETRRPPAPRRRRARNVKCKCPWPVSVVKTVLTNSSATQLRTVELGLELELGHKFRKDKIKEFRLT